MQHCIEFACQSAMDAKNGCGLVVVGGIWCAVIALSSWGLAEGVKRQDTWVMVLSGAGLVVSVFPCVIVGTCAAVGAGRRWINRCCDSLFSPLPEEEVPATADDEDVAGLLQHHPSLL